MKKITLLLSTALLFTAALNAQEEGEKGFKKENLFTGGSVTLSFFNGQTVLGANPIFGYKLADWADAGLALNYLYNGARDYYQYNDKIKQTVVGPGVFARLYPVKFLFVQAQFEKNFSTLKYTPSNTNPVYTAYKEKNDANSFLVGGGFASGRERGATSFFYISVLFDVIKDVNSPYVRVNYNPDNPAQRRVDMVPVIRAGVNVGLFQGRYR